MSDDIVTRLRERSRRFWQTGLDNPAFEMAKAADEIERLRAEVARLGSFLHPIGAVINEQAVRGE